ncbi:MAG TPA: ABC transporter permease [Gaiellaceae bacterium]|nr:ABC transporter permease [Gaiellaceae bacterium]
MATSEDLLTVTTGEDVLGVPPEPVRGSVALRTLQLLLPAVGAFGVICVAVLVLGADPLLVLGKMISGSLGSQYDVSEVLMVMAPLILCGLAAAVPFSARLWNIGGDGQLYVGAVAAVVVGLNVGKDVPGELLAALCVLAGIAAGACWAIVAGLVKVLVAGNEVIVTLMLNLLAGLAADYVVTGPYAQGVSPQTKTIPSGATFGSFWQTGFNQAIFIAIAVALAVGVFMQRTRAGFGIRASGENLDASRLAGFAVHRLWVGAFGLGGACAGLAGALLVVAVYGAVIPGMGEQYGYTGIAVALVARLRPLLLIPSAALFAVIQVGGSGLSANAGVSPAITYVIQGVIVISFLAFRVLRVRI